MIEIQIAGLVLVLLVLAALILASRLWGADSRYNSDGLQYDHRSNW